MYILISLILIFIVVISFLFGYCKGLKHNRKIFERLADLSMEQFSCDECTITDNDCKECFKYAMKEIEALCDEE